MSESIGNYEEHKNLIPLYTEGDPNAYLYDEVNPVARKVRYFDTNLAIVNDRFVFDMDSVTSTQDVSMVAKKYSITPIYSKILNESDDGYKYVAESRIRLGTVPQGLGVSLVNRKYTELFYNHNSVQGSVTFEYINRDFIYSRNYSYFPSAGFVANDTVLLRLVIENPYGFDAVILTGDISNDANANFGNWAVVTILSDTSNNTYYPFVINRLLNDNSIVTVPKKSELAIDVGVSNLTQVSGLKSDTFIVIAHRSNLRGFFVTD